MKKVWTGLGSIDIFRDLIVVAPIALGVAGCGEDPPRRAPPPPIASAAAPGACSQADTAPRDPIARSLLPARSGAYCLDPHGGDRAYGEDAERPYERACDELLDGECEVYRSFGALRTLEARYIDDAGGSASVVVHLTKLNTAEGAYAMFTLRVVGDGDPGRDAAERPMNTKFAAAVGDNNAYVTRGPYLAEIVFLDDTAGSVAELRARAEGVVTRLAKDVGDKLQGDLAPPPAVTALPVASRVPLGVRYHTKDLFGIAGVGPGAIGYYREGDKRYRVAAMLRTDPDQAKDLLAMFERQPGASRKKAPYDGFVHVIVQAPGDVPAEWVLGRARGVVLGLGDEVRVIDRTMTSEDRSKVLLSTQEKMSKLKGMLEAVQSR